MALTLGFHKRKKALSVLLAQGKWGVSLVYTPHLPVWPCVFIEGKLEGISNIFITPDSRVYDITHMLESDVSDQKTH